jgi:probable HAF family extracellular repeat protein
MLSEMKNRARLRVSMLAGACAVCCGLAGHAFASGTLTPIPSYVDPNGGSTSVLGINNSGFMTGTIGYSDGSSLGFTRDPGGTYSLFSEGFATVGRAIDESNTVSGYVTDASQSQLTDNEFRRTSGGVTTLLQNPLDMSFLHGIAQGMNSSGAIVGDYFTGSPGPRHGYILDGATFTDLSAPGSSSTRARAITDAGEVAGWTIIGGVTHAFLWNSGVFTLIDDPNAVGATYFEDLNNHGIASGAWLDGLGDTHAFEYNTHSGMFTEINVPGATNTEAFGLDDLGRAVITTDLAVGPNNFLFAPVPEPGAWAMMIVGVFGAGAMLRSRRRRAEV